MEYLQALVTHPERERDMFKEVIETLSPSIEINPNPVQKPISYSGKKYTVSEFVYSAEILTLIFKECKKSGKDVEQEAQELVKDLEERIKKERADREAEKMGPLPSSMGLEVYIDQTRIKGESRPDIRFFNPAEKKEYHTSEYLFVRKFPKWFAEAIPAYFTYKPTLPPGPYKEKVRGEEYTFYNSYVAPFYREKEPPKAYGEYVEMLNALVDHLLPVKKERDYFFFWARQSLVSKARTFLVLPGNSGIGKTLLAEIVILLHGRDNVSRSNTSSMKKFNAPISKKSLVLYDEIAWTEEDIPVMKSYVEDFGPLELKGVDQKTAEYTASFMVCNNEPHKCPMIFDDRKFAVLEVTKVKLAEGIGTEYANKLHSLVKDGTEESDIFAREVYEYVLERGDIGKKFPKGEYRGREFFSICHLTMPRKDKEMINSFISPPPFLEKIMAESQDEEGWMPFLRIYDAYFEAVAPKRGRIEAANPNRLQRLLFIYTNLLGEKIFEVTEVDEGGLDFKFRFIKRKNIKTLKQEVDEFVALTDSDGTELL